MTAEKVGSLDIQTARPFTIMKRIHQPLFYQSFQKNEHTGTLLKGRK